MNFNNHSNLEGQHAFLGASKYSWVNYDEDKLDISYDRQAAKILGTRLHDLADEHIKLGLKLPRTNKTLDMYVNDAIGYKMKSEQILFYSYNCFGTADTISFKNNLLRIHDYKSGVNKASFKQLEIYAAIFCLEYEINPNNINIKLKIYQNDLKDSYEPDKEDILYIMDKIIRFDKRIEVLKIGG